MRRWSVCKKFHKCEFCENQGPSPGLRTRKGLDIDSPIAICYLERGQTESRRYELRPAEPGKTKRGGFPDMEGNNEEKERAI